MRVQPFSRSPKMPKGPPSDRRYRAVLFFWASLYAWDRAEGLSTTTAARNLARIALIDPVEEWEQEAEGAHEQAS